MKRDEAFPPKVTKKPNASTAFVAPDPLVTPELRNLIFNKYEGLKNAEPDRQLSALRMMAYILFGTFFDKNADEGERRLVASQEIVAVIEGKKSTSFYTSGRFLSWFDKNILPLNIGDEDKNQGVARSIAPRIDKAIWDAWEATPLNGANQVVFSTGKPPVTSTLKQKRREVEEKQRKVMEQTSSDDPTRPLVDYLLGQGKQITFKEVLRANKEAVIEYIESLPLRSDESGTEWTSKKGYAKNVARRIFTEFGDVPSLYYTVSQNTPRLSPLGVHVHSLPREARKIAFRGAIEFDLRACQLAVIAHLWDIPELKAMLADENDNFWDVMLSHLGLAKNEKPDFKEAIYATIFGMGKKNVEQRLVDIDWFDDGYAEKFKSHPIIQELFNRRKIKMKELESTRMVVDAFGRVRTFNLEASTSIFSQQRNHLILRREMAFQAQSYELKLMLSVMNVLHKEQIKLLLWLHDGVTLYFNKPSKHQQWINRLQKAVKEESAKHNIITQLDYKHL